MNLNYSYIAIEGNIGAGKTSLSTKMAEQFSSKIVLEEFADNPFLPKFYENQERYAFPVELSFLAERYAQLKEELGSRNLFHSTVIADYFLSKSFIFAKANLKGPEFELFMRMYDIIKSDLPAPDLLVYLYVDEEKLLENIQKRGREYEQNITKKYLKSIQKSYLTFIRQHRKLRTVIIDTSEVDFVNNPKDYERMVEIINSPYKKGIHKVKA